MRRPGSSGSIARSRRSSASRSSAWRSSRCSTTAIGDRSSGRRSARSLLVGFQAWLGRETVRLGNSGESVTAHLAAAMVLVGVLVFLTVRAGFPARLPTGREPALHDPRRLHGAGDVHAAAVRVARHRDRLRAGLSGLAADGRAVSPRRHRSDLARTCSTAGSPRSSASSWRRSPWWRGGPNASTARSSASRPGGGTVRPAGRRRRAPGPHPAVGMESDPPPGARRGRVGPGRGLAATSYYTAATDGARAPWTPRGRPTARRAPRRDTIRAYIALTKPRIIELLLVTTVPGDGPRDALGAGRRLGRLGRGSWSGR